MYNENSNFSIKNVIVQFLFVALFVFILIWLFPLKSDLSKLKTTSNDNKDLSVLVDRIFNENIIAMKEAAKSYYTLERLPKNVGDKVKMTLGEMLDKKIILPFKDKNGNACDLTASYVEVTKYDTEYLMKVNLKCGKEENYLLVYMGCYDYCSTTICEKKNADVKAPVIYTNKESKPSPSVKPQPQPQPQPTPVVENPVCEYRGGNYYGKNRTIVSKEQFERECKETPKEYLYEYTKVVPGYYTESDWSDWGTAKVTPTENRAVKTKTRTTTKLIGYNVKTEYDKSKPIYENIELETGAYKVTKECSGSTWVPTGEYSYSEYQLETTVYLNYSPSDTETVKYVKVGESDWTCTGNCTAGTTKAYEKWVRTATPVVKWQCTGYTEKKVPVTVTSQKLVGYETKTTKTPVYDTKTEELYSYKTRTFHPETKDTKWSIYGDTTLLNSGYSYTGNKKEK